MNILISQEVADLALDAALETEIRRAAEKIGALYDLKNAEVSITLTDDTHIKALNFTYRGIDRPTDVLSFALNESSEPLIKGDAFINILGDIVLSVERAKAQAADFGHSLKRELVFLTVHGMLHLLGYDHTEEAARLEMENEQRQVMASLGIFRKSASEEEGKVMAKKKHKSGFIAVVGRPNVGKSTLINSLIGQKIAIMSDKPQTTRTRILCILTEPDAQIIFLDTPGIHKPRHKLGEYMVRAAESTLKEVDAVFFVVDATEKMGAGERYILERLKATKCPCILVVNKLDLIEKPAVLPILENYMKAYPFAGAVPISAKNAVNLDALFKEVKKYLPEGPFYYPKDMVTDQPERLIVSELVREKALLATHDEIPHAIAVEIDEMTARPKGDFYIRAIIYVERESQKGIVIGAKGALLREIGAAARKDIERLLAKKVFLDLWVKVKKDWRNREGILNNFGLR